VHDRLLADRNMWDGCSCRRNHGHGDHLTMALRSPGHRACGRDCGLSTTCRGSRQHKCL